MTTNETIKALKILFAFGLSNAPKISEDKDRAAEEWRELSKAYQFAWSDLPAVLIEQAVREWIRGDNAFWPRAGQLRSLALRAGAGLPAAEVAWEEVRRNFGAVGRYAFPRWSSAVLERAVNAMGWAQLCDWPAESVGVCRAQFRDTYNAVLEETLRAGDAPGLLADAERRRAALAAGGPVERPTLGADPAPAGALPAASCEPAPAPSANPPSTIRARERFAARHPRALPAGVGANPDPEGALRRLTQAPEWAAMPADVRDKQLARYLAKHPECAGMPEMRGVTPAPAASPVPQRRGSLLADRPGLRLVEGEKC